MRISWCLLALAAALAAAPAAYAQQHDPANGLLLVAKPELLDPNFSRTVVLVHQTEDGSTVGVILNRPSGMKLAELLSEDFASANYRDAVYFGGPVMRQAIVALFRAERPPAAAAFHVLKDLYLTMHPENIKALLADPKQRYRIYAGFSGWAPRQLESEFMREGWYALPADAETALRRNTEGLWTELLRKASVPRPQTRKNESPAVGGAGCPDSPGGAARAALVASWHEATHGARRDAASFSTAHGLSRYPDRSPGIPRDAARQPRLRAPGENLAPRAPCYNRSGMI